MRTVVICGYGSDSGVEVIKHHQDVEIWRVAWDESGPADRWFEIHHPRLWLNENPITNSGRDYLDHLTSLGGELVLEHVNGTEGKYGKFLRYPIERVLTMLGMETGYLCSTIGYELALAHIEGIQRVHLVASGFGRGQWQECVFERPNIAYLIGLFGAQGMDVAVPRSSEFFDLMVLRDLPTPDFLNSKMKRWHLEFFLGREIGRTGQMPQPFREDLMSVPWRNPSRYGYQLLEETGVNATDVAPQFARELGIYLDD